MASLPTPPGSRDPTPQDKDKTPPPAFETDTPANSEEINTSKSLAPPSTTPDHSAPSAGNDKSTPSAESRVNGEDGDEGSTGGSAELKRKSPHDEEPAAANNRRGRWADVTDEEVKYILTKLNLPTDGLKEDKVKRLEAEKWTQADIVEWKKNGGKQGKTLKHGTFDEIHQKVKERALGGGGVVIPADTSVPAQQPAYNEGGLSHDTSGPTDPHSIDTGKSTQIQAGQDESRTRNQATGTSLKPIIGNQEINRK